MRAFYLTAVALCVLAGCRPSEQTPIPGETIVPSAGLPLDMTTPAERAEMEKAAREAGIPVTPQSRAYFQCGPERRIMVRFFPEQGVAVLTLDGETHELQGEPVASGFFFGNGRYSIRGGADALELLIGRMAPIACHLTTADGQPPLGPAPTVPPPTGR